MGHNIPVAVTNQPLRFVRPVEARQMHGDADTKTMGINAQASAKLGHQMVTGSLTCHDWSTSSSMTSASGSSIFSARASSLTST